MEIYCQNARPKLNSHALTQKRDFWMVCHDIPWTDGKRGYLNENDFCHCYGDADMAIVEVA